MISKVANKFTRLHGVLRRFKRNERGVTAVEMALIAPAFFLFLMGTTEMGLMLAAQQLLEHAAFSTSRLAKTGFVSAGHTQMETVSQVMTKELQSYGHLIDTSNVIMTSTAYTSFGNIGAAGQGTEGLGAEEQIVVYTVTFPWKLFTPMMSDIIGTNGFVNLKTRIVVRNEPYG